MGNKDKIRQLAEKVMQGTATDEERKMLHQWYDGKNFEEGEELRIPEKSSKNRIYRNIVKQMSKNVKNDGVVSLRSYSKWIWPAAAILFMVLSYTLYYFTASQNTTQWISVNVPLGKMEKIMLPDSSVVWLNAGSQFRYPTQYSKSERHVELVEGQAFFEVQKNKEWPFTVGVHELLVTVVGTSFEVKSFADEKNALVGVKTGRVNISLQNRNQKTSLHPGDIASVDKSSGEMAQWTKDPQSIGSWKENRLIFDGEPLGEVVNALERKYNVRISAKTPDLLSLPVTIKTDNQPLGDILEVLGYSLGFKFTMDQENNEVTIFKE